MEKHAADRNGETHAMNRPENVRAQYGDDRNLSERIKLHNLYSTNPQGYVPWLFEKYRFAEGDRILELGCGNANQWTGNLDRLPAGCHLTLTDLSEGMVEAVRVKFAGRGHVTVLRADISHVPFPDGAFDAVIANHMLYHVPDLDGALSEVARALKPGGRFYAATNGSNGIHAYLNRALRAVNPGAAAFDDFSFSLQNGGEILKRHFGRVERHDYPDSLRVTVTEDWMDWIRSALSMSNLSEGDLAGLAAHFEAIRRREGAIAIPKESGLFIAEKGRVQ